MIRIGIVGSDNSHAIAFSKLCNVEGNELHVDGAKVVSIFGVDPERTQEVAQHGNIPKIVDTPEEMIGEIDLAMVVFRHGGLHRQYAEPLLRAGIPTFVDKPLALSPQDARALIAAAEKAGVPFTSFSTLRYSADMRTFVQEANEVGPFHFSSFAGPADRQSEYGGLPFYGVHIAEMMAALNGSGVKSVHAVENRETISASVVYEDDKTVTLNFLGKATYVFHMSVFGENGWKARALDSGTCYKDGMEIVLDMVNTGKWPLTKRELMESVLVLTAVEQSLVTGKSVDVAIL